MQKALYFMAALAISPNYALSADLCKALALRDVTAVEAPDSVLARGSYDDWVTQYRVNKQTGTTTLARNYFAVITGSEEVGRLNSRARPA
jgi:hypothetical protein